LNVYNRLKELGEGQQDFDWHGAYVDHFCDNPGEVFFAIEDVLFDFSGGDITLKKPEPDALPCIE
jgi:hypothetical protein